MFLCFFWYRPTRVVPDQRRLNGRCCCCTCISESVHFCRLCDMLCISGFIHDFMFAHDGQERRLSIDLVGSGMDLLRLTHQGDQGQHLTERSVISTIGLLSLLPLSPYMPVYITETKGRFTLHTDAQIYALYEQPQLN